MIKSIDIIYEIKLNLLVTNMKITYRPEIDGLRAIAVVAVILYHAQISIFGVNHFKGGFIGVDIFFVISGYLITKIIIKELLNTGSFSFKYFYERRIRRILPVLLFVMLVSLPFAWLYLLPREFIDFSKSILYSLGFSSNFYFHFSGQTYGDIYGLFKPFLHTWSLSIEEQYYILFPLIFIIIFKYFRTYLLATLIVGFIFSLLLSEWGSRTHPSFNFYALPTRGWELIAGSILAYFEVQFSDRNKNSQLNTVLSATGLLLIFHYILFYNSEVLHPSINTLSPIIGVCLVIWFTKDGEIITRILSSKLFVGIGLISYSLYLWHYPIFAFARIRESIWQYNKLEWIILTVILSLVSYFLIEKPFRNKNIQFKLIFLTIISFIIIIVSLQLLVILNKGYKNRIPQVIKTALTIPSTLLDKELSKNILQNDGKRLSKIFNINIDMFANSKNNIVLVGDSHSATLSYDLKTRLKDKNIGLVFSIYEECQLILNTNLVNKKTYKVYRNCSTETQRNRLEFINKHKSSIVVMFSRLTNILEEERFVNPELGNEEIMEQFIQNSNNSLKTKKDRKKYIFDNYKYTIDKLIENGHKVILIYPMPEVGISVPHEIFRKAPINLSLDKEFMDSLLTTPFNLYKFRTQSTFELLDSITGDNVYKVYPHKLFCNTVVRNRCVTHDKEKIFYYDNNHPSLTGAEMINNLIIKEIEKIE